MYELPLDFDRLVFLQRPQLWLGFEVLRLAAPSTSDATAAANARLQRGRLPEGQILLRVC